MTNIRVSVNRLAQGLKARTQPRSRLPTLNIPSPVNSNYWSEFRGMLANLDSNLLTFTRDVNIAQIIISPVVLAGFVKTANLPQIEFSQDGAGSTGIAS